MSKMGMRMKEKKWISNMMSIERNILPRQKKLKTMKITLKIIIIDKLKIKLLKSLSV
jgi:hypothetical protein